MTLSRRVGVGVLLCLLNLGLSERARCFHKGEGWREIVELSPAAAFLLRVRRASMLQVSGTSFSAVELRRFKYSATSPWSVFSGLAHTLNLRARAPRFFVKSLLSKLYCTPTPTFLDPKKNSRRLLPLSTSMFNSRTCAIYSMTLVTPSVAATIASLYNPLDSMLEVRGLG